MGDTSPRLVEGCRQGQALQLPPLPSQSANRLVSYKTAWPLSTRPSGRGRVPDAMALAARPLVLHRKRSRTIGPTHLGRIRGSGQWERHVPGASGWLVSDEEAIERGGYMRWRLPFATSSFASRRQDDLVAEYRGRRGAAARPRPKRRDERNLRGMDSAG